MKLAIIGQQDFGKAVLEAFLARGDEVVGVFCAQEKEGAKPDPLKVRDITYLDYRDIRILERFLNDRGKLLPNRITGVTAKAQRRLEEAVKHARHLALLPFVAEGMK